MNITNQGYYTSSYIDNVRQNKMRKQHNDCYRYGAPGNIMYHEIGWDPVAGRPDTSGFYLVQSSRNSSSAQVNESTPKYAATPTFGMEPLRSAPRNRRHLGERYNHSSKRANLPAYGTPTNVDPDSLGVEITPAQLNNILRRKGEPRKLKHSSSSNGFDGYYIDQKQLYDQAEYKPKLYSHRTFKDVFEDKEENTDRYNPAELIFDSPEDRRETPRYRKALKSFQRFVNKTQYKDYDFFSHNHEETDEDTDVSTNVTVDNSERIDEASNSIYITAEEEEAMKKEKKTRNIFKRKLRKAKKRLNNDFNEYSKAMDRGKIEELSDDESEKDTEADVPPESDNEVSPESPKNIPAQTEPADDEPKKPEFHLAWNYILSWLVYDSLKVNQEEEKPSISPPRSSVQSKKDNKLVTISRIIDNSASKVLIKPETKIDLQKLKKNYKQITSNWNKPAHTVFASGKQPLYKSFPRNDQEIEVEVDSEDDIEMDAALVYNPSTRRLEKITTDSDSASKMGNTANKHENSGNLISNIDKLIKSIRLMQIIFAPIDMVSKTFPNLQTLVILVELVIFTWLLYELSLLIDALCMMIRAIFAPMVAIGKFVNRITT